jgi:hypothetical protein
MTHAKEIIICVKFVIVFKLNESLFDHIIIIRYDHRWIPRIHISSVEFVKRQTL